MLSQVVNIIVSVLAVDFLVWHSSQYYPPNFQYASRTTNAHHTPYALQEATPGMAVA